MFDFIQQSLRTVGLEYGAGLFYVSTLRPNTVTDLRSYLLHILFSFTKEQAFQCNVKPQVLERDTIFIPCGWDSIGKIKMTKDTFPCETYLDPTTVSANLMTDYAVVIKKPIDNTVCSANKIINDHLIIPENEQEFLERQATLLKSLDPVEPSDAGKVEKTDKSDYQAKIARLLVF